MKSSTVALLCRLALAARIVAGISSFEGDQRSFQIMNESGGNIEVHWIDLETGDMVRQTEPDISPGETFELVSFVGHAFQVRQVPDKTTVACVGGDSPNQCQVEYFTLDSNIDQVIIVEEGFEIHHTTSRSIATLSALELLQSCKDTSMRLLQLSISPEDALEAIAQCIKFGISREIRRLKEEVSFHAQARENLANLLDNYTCADESLNTTTAKETMHWEGRKVHVMMDRPTSKIHVVEDFITEEECKAVEMTAAAVLVDATVSDGMGGEHSNEVRKAKHAAISVNWNKEQDGDLISSLSRRVVNYINNVLPLNTHHKGQEDIMSIQYFERGPDDTTPVRYLPQCDGDCNGLNSNPGSRVAAMVMYCSVPTVGGATNFRNSGVHIKPTKYAATFFSNIDPDTMKMDDSLTEHRGCPVIEGETKIVTQWVRLGVDDEMPWSSWNTFGAKYSDVPSH